MGLMIDPRRSAAGLLVILVTEGSLLCLCLYVVGCCLGAEGICDSYDG